ncbi:cuscuta receptor 1 [Quercus suber]|uniref:cuscuta receptor 1 n=1 Tax=Quercus suber TaxID=58331 RepID=UPI0032DF7D63
MTSLNVLTVHNCGLNGNLPTQGWCELQKLQELDLSNNNFEGTLPSCLANLKSLRVLDISYNHFNGNIAQSQLSSLTSLEYLSLSNNQLLNPITLSSWTPASQLKVFSMSKCSFNGLNKIPPKFLQFQYHLLEIDLSHNNLTGMFPTWLLKNNPKLEVLSLRNNSFVGPFQMPYHFHPSITSIDISDNDLTGPIPTNFGLIFPNLENLNLSRNEFQGSIPTSFENLVSLKALDLSNNCLSGTILEHFSMSWTSLTYLKLSYNNYSGQIFPSNFNLTKLQFLLLDNNKFSGKIPSSFSSNDFLSIDFSNNALFGMLPRWMGNMSNLGEILLAKNQLEGPIPMELCKLVGITFLDLSENNLSGSIPSCFNSSSIKHVHLNKNRLSGPITSAFRNSSSLVTLNLRDNYLTGNIPDWIGSLSSLSILLLKANHLEGRIPVQLCLLHNLSMLDLSYNEFSGPIPHCLSNISFMATNHISDFGGISIFKNNFKKKSPFAYLETKLANIRDEELGNFYSFQLVDAKQEVEFTTKGRTYSYQGDILNYMSGIDLSCNRLAGEIPSELGSISNIHALNLSHNNLIGSIPTTFSNLKKIESLDLSYNNLGGRIPPQLIELTTLEVFKVAHNNLSGPTPDRKAQFGTFDENSYEGNPLLCGPPLHKECTEPTMLAADYGGEEGDSFIDMDVFYITFTVAYITVLGIISLLCINPYWRQVWLRFIEVCIDICYGFVVRINFNIHALNLSHNNLIGSIPTTFSNLKKIESLDLSYNNLGGRIPPQLIELTTLEVFKVAHNNLSGPTPERKAQFGTFDENSYEGNPLLCGAPLHKECTEPTMLAADYGGEEGDSFIDMDVFYITFTVAYITVLGIISLLCINPYWRQVWLRFIEVCIDICYGFVADLVVRCGELVNFRIA